MDSRPDGICTVKSRSTDGSLYKIDSVRRDEQTVERRRLRARAGLRLHSRGIG